VLIVSSDAGAGARLHLALTEPRCGSAPPLRRATRGGRRSTGAGHPGAAWLQLPGWPSAGCSGSGQGEPPADRPAVHAVVVQRPRAQGLWLSCAAAVHAAGGHVLLCALQRPALPALAAADAAGGEAPAPAQWRTLLLLARRADAVPDEPWGSALSLGTEQGPPAVGSDAADRPARLVLALPSGPAAGRGGLDPAASLVAWSPGGDLLAVAVAARGGGACWLLVLGPDLAVLHDCDWRSAVGPPPEGAPRCQRRRGARARRSGATALCTSPPPPPLLESACLPCLQQPTAQHAPKLARHTTGHPSQARSRLTRLP
jgi:hypothetical protein